MSGFQVENSVEVSSIDDLEAYFHAGGKPSGEWKIGVEYEKPVVRRADARAVPYEGTTGIGAILETLAQRYAWTRVYEAENVVALHDGRASITLEPGGQLELSGELCDSLHCAHTELTEHTRQILEVGSELGVAFLGLGMTPRTPLEELPWMPKERYRIMRRIMRETGKLGHRMMQQTATVQANFDYADEADAKAKFRVAMAMSPVLVAMTANSPMADGRMTGYKSYRAHVWTDTDPARCGILPFAFDTDALFAAYTRYALDVPMYFVARGPRLLPAEGRTFRDFLAHGLDGEHATLGDWATHLTTLFPEARLKSYIEVRAADGQPSQLVLATPALMKGLLYDSDCLAASWDLLCKWTLDQRRQLLVDAARDGLRADGPRYRLVDYAKELVSIAREGLRRQARLDGAGEDERVYLGELERLVLEGLCPADRFIDAWHGSWRHDFTALVHGCSYGP